MTAAYVPAVNSLGARTVRLSDDDLHRVACKAMHAGEHEVFRTLPGMLNEIIKHKVWKTRTVKFGSFGEYALNRTSEGLGVTNNQLLWMLKCAMDTSGAHIREWASVIEEVEKCVKVYAKGKTSSLDGNSLETLAKTSTDQSKTITYLPSANKNLDGALARLRKNNPAIYHRVLSGEISVRHAIRKEKPKTNARDPVDRIFASIKKLSPVDIARLVKMMTTDGHLNHE